MSRSYQTSVSPSVAKLENNYATTVLENQGSQGSNIFDFINSSPKTSRNIVIPFV